MTAASGPARVAAGAVKPAAGRDVTVVRVTAAAVCLLGAASLAWAFYAYPVVFPGATLLAAALQLPVLLLGFVVFRWFRPGR